MAREITGSIDGARLRVGIVVSQFNEAITSRLVGGAREALSRHSVREDAVTIVTVPGALELPQAAQQMAESGDWDALVTLGCVIRGETTHYDLVAAECARGIADVARTFTVAIAFGVLTTENTDQAMARSGGAMGNRGFDAVVAAIKMANLRLQIKEASAKEEMSR
jgi:6,7-dimethyl-8-ribityllumazine synthase